MDVRFQWLKPPKGYEWRRFPVTIDGEIRRYWRLVPVSGGRWTDRNDERGLLKYTPPPGLFRVFARITVSGEYDAVSGEDGGRETGREAIRAFACGYGDILVKPHERTDKFVRSKHVKYERRTPEAAWISAIQDMSRAVHLWDETKDATKRKRAAQVARLALQSEIRRALTDTDTVMPRFTTADFAPEMTLVMRPANLLAFMWLSFARVVSGEIEERRCEMFRHCGNYVYIGRGPGLRRGDNSVTCSDKCRKRKSRGGG